MEINSISFFNCTIKYILFIIDPVTLVGVTFKIANAYDKVFYSPGPAIDLPYKGVVSCVACPGT
jgi:hypothetical protein